MILALAVAGCAARSTSTATNSPPTGPIGRDAGLAAFETVRSVLQHPRCQNCHPPGDAPLQGDDGHPHQQNVLRGPAGMGRVGEECSTCHGTANLPASYGLHVPPGASEGWRMPPPERRLVFVGMSSRSLCEQIQDPKRNGGMDRAALRAHLDTPLVVWGWDPGNGRAPVPIARPVFLEAWATWASAGTPCPN